MRLTRRTFIQGGIGVVSLGVAPAFWYKNFSAAAVAESEESVEQFTPYQAQSSLLFDRTTLLQKWVAPKLPGAPPDRAVQVTPVLRDTQLKLTGQKRAPVTAVRSPAGTKYALDLGRLPIGTYVVRVIGMVKTEDIDQYRKPLAINLTINDKVGGGESFYVQRTPYLDDFYAIAEIYFNADEVRNYAGTLAVDAGSAVDLYIDSIEFHDVLKNLAHRAAKTAPSTYTLEERDMMRCGADAAAILAQVGKNMALDEYILKGPELSSEDRKKRDDILWNAFPPLNTQYMSWYPAVLPATELTANEAAKATEAQAGAWDWPYYWKYGLLRPFELENKKLNLKYTRDDLAAHRPLPDPYPVKDNGTGAYFSQRGEMKHAEWYAPIAKAMGSRWAVVVSTLGAADGSDETYRLPYLYHALGNERAARDAALLLARWATIYPTFTDAMLMGFNMVAPGSIYNRDMRLRQRYLNFGLSSLQQGLAQSYDELFPYINGNQELARAVGRYIPWVKTDADVRRLVETRVLQFGAKQSLHFNLFSDKGSPYYLMNTALAQQDAEITRPWMEFLWRETWIYPHAKAGLPDYLSTTTQRDGTTDIGSVFYTWHGSDFLKLALMTRRYVENGGDKKYDLTDFDKYSKLLSANVFCLDSAVAGGYPMTIGDVGDPARYRVYPVFNYFEDDFRTGFALTGDPRFAWLVQEYFGRRNETDEQWNKLVAAAAKQQRNPFLDQRPRVLANWAGVLESGRESDDFRFKRAAVLRVGTGYGHAHSDTLDLQVFAHGVRAVNDVGWRGSYSYPSSVKSQLHNVVEVDEEDWKGHAWISVFSPADGAQFMRGVATPPVELPAAKWRYRDVALIDVDEGTPGAKPPEPWPYNETTQFDPAAITPNSYVFDVERVSGGSLHTYCFHGTVSDDFQINVPNKNNFKGEETAYLRRFLQDDGLRLAGDAPGVLEATWRLRRAEETLTGTNRNGEKSEFPQKNSEHLMQTGSYNAATPRKFTRLHLLGHEGERVLSAYFEPKFVYDKSTWPFLFVQKRGTDLQSVYPAIIEPYAGEPFIASTRLLPIEGNEDDALCAVAVEVKTRNGHTDLCFSDGRNKPRAVGSYSINGRFAYVSGDAKGLRLAHLVEGTSLKTPWGTLTVAQPEYSGRITKVDYWKRKVWLAGAWPEAAQLSGAQVEFGNDQHKTSYTVVSAAKAGNQTVLTLDKALDLSYAHVVNVDPARKRVTVNVGTVTAFPGMNAGLTCTNDGTGKSWRCRIVSGERASNYVYQLAEDVTAQDFPIGSEFRLWELGVGDAARLATHAVVRRGADGKYSVESNAKASWKAR
jgi:hypothetical protein